MINTILWVAGTALVAVGGGVAAVLWSATQKHVQPNADRQVGRLIRRLSGMSPLGRLVRLLVGEESSVAPPSADPSPQPVANPDPDAPPDYIEDKFFGLRWRWRWERQGSGDWVPVDFRPYCLRRGCDREVEGQPYAPWPYPKTSFRCTPGECDRESILHGYPNDILSRCEVEVLRKLRLRNARKGGE